MDCGFVATGLLLAFFFFFFLSFIIGLFAEEKSLFTIIIF